MPTTVVGVLTIIVFLTPGFLYTAQRRLTVPEARRSPLMETTAVVSISVVALGIVGLVFGIIRAVLPSHTPDLGRLLAPAPSSTYWADNLPYVLAWSGAALLAASGLAVTAARWSALHDLVRRILPQEIVETSAWNRTLTATDDSWVHVGIELLDGGFVSGRLDWSSTDIDETPNRDLVLCPPLRVRTERDDGTTTDFDPGSQRIIISATQISRIDVTPVIEDVTPVIEDNPHR